jgi:hypothetical protein
MAEYNLEKPLIPADRQYCMVDDRPVESPEEGEIYLIAFMIRRRGSLCRLTRSVRSIIG